MFLREVMGKIVYFSPNAVNGMLTSHCDNLSTHHYHLKYHHCFDTLIRYDETTQQYFHAVSADHIDQKAIWIVSYPFYYHSYPAACISASVTFFWVSVSLESVVVLLDSLPCAFGFASYSWGYLSRLPLFPFSVSLGISNVVVAYTNYQSEEWKLQKLGWNSSKSTVTTYLWSKRPTAMPQIPAQNSINLTFCRVSISRLLLWSKLSRLFVNQR